MSRVHHSAIVTRNVDESRRFWCEGLGFSVLMDESFDGDWPRLFGATTTRLRSLFLGASGDTESGIVELVDFGRQDDAAVGGVASRSRADDLRPPPEPGFLLLSLRANLDEVLPRLARLGLGGEPETAEVAPGVRLCVVTDPNGVLVELMDGASDPTTGSI